MRSFEELPPTHMIRLTSFAMVPDRELTKRVRRFLERLRYRVACEYLVVNEWSDGHRHMHLLVRTAGTITPELVSNLWEKVMPGPMSAKSSYCRPVASAARVACYVVKHVRDAAKKEVAPKSYAGRVMTYSKGFLSQSMEALWREQCRQWKHGLRSGSAPSQEGSQSCQTGATKI
jgi:hypothetical protein